MSYLLRWGLQDDCHNDKDLSTRDWRFRAFGLKGKSFSVSGSGAHQLEQSRPRKMDDDNGRLSLVEEQRLEVLVHLRRRIWSEQDLIAGRSSPSTATY